MSSYVSNKEITNKILGVPQEDIWEALDVLEAHFGTEKARQIIAAEGLRPLTERVGKKLTSFMAFPDRGEGGSNSWGGNCSPEVVRQLVQYCQDWAKFYKYPIKNFKLVDPMGGGGTSHEVGKQMGINVSTYDLNPNYKFGKAGWNALKDDIEDSADLIFFHPPYHDMLIYSGRIWGKDSKAHPDDLSRCANYKDFIDKLNFITKKLYMSLRKNGRLAVLVGDYRKNGKFYSIQNDMMKIGDMESFIVKAQYNCNSDNRTYAKPFVPIVTEYLLVFQKKDCFIVPMTFTNTIVEDIRKVDDATITWKVLIDKTLESLGGKATFRDLYDKLREHPKSKKNQNYDARIRATIYDNKEEYINYGNGTYGLKYMVA